MVNGIQWYFEAETKRLSTMFCPRSFKKSLHSCKLWALSKCTIISLAKNIISSKTRFNTFNKFTLLEWL